jgi:Protein of unknown function (DUF3135)
METKELTIKNRLTPFDFDCWRQLAEEDPQSFDEHRRRAINEVIDSSPVAMRSRLRGLQWRIDMEIRRSKNAMDSCLRINRLMLDSVYARSGLVETVRSLIEAEDCQHSPLSKAAVIPLFRQGSGT